MPGLRLLRPLYLGVDITVHRGDAEVDMSVGLMIDFFPRCLARIIQVGSQDPRWACSGLTSDEQAGAIAAAWEQIGMALRSSAVPS